MDRRSILLEMRKAGQLKGQKPCFVMTKYRDDKIHTGTFIMSIRNEILYFQKISRIFNMLRPTEDFKIQIKDYVAYKFEAKRARTVFILYKDNAEYVSVEYMTGTKETFATEDNMERISRDLDTLGLKRVKEIGNDQ